MMKKVGALLMSFLIAESLLSQTNVTADISNIRNDKGVCRACLFNSPSSFKGETGKPFLCVAVPVKNKTTKAVFNNVPVGTYAMFVFHDENSNNKMDKNFMGIPKEGYGASKNKLPFAGAPTFNENKFTVDGKSAIVLQVKMRNL
jgi:uncharacterized protein (DUF2141 family)